MTDTEFVYQLAMTKNLTESVKKALEKKAFRMAYSFITEYIDRSERAYKLLKTVQSELFKTVFPKTLETGIESANKALEELSKTMAVVEGIRSFDRELISNKLKIQLQSLKDLRDIAMETKETTTVEFLDIKIEDLYNEINEVYPEVILKNQEVLQNTL